MDNPKLLDHIVMSLNQKECFDAKNGNLLSHVELSEELVEEGLPDETLVMEEIFYQLCEELDEVSHKLDKGDASLGKLFQTIYLMYLVQKKYRFVFLNLTDIVRKSENIKDRYYELVSLRKTQLLHLFQMLERDGILRGEILPGQYANLANQIILMSEYWLAQSCLIFDKSENGEAFYYSKLVFSALVPYLSEPGLGDYESVVTCKNKSELTYC